MALNIWTGFHWCSPVNANNNAMAEESLQKTGRWGATILMYNGNNPNDPTRLYANQDFADACDQVMNAREAVNGGRSLDQCVARLWFGQPLTINSPGQPNNIASVSDADNWLRTNGYYDSLNYFVSNHGQLCVVFNELNQPSEPQYNIDPRIMGYLGFALQNAYWINYPTNPRLLFTLFPGPTGLLGSQGAFDNYFQANYGNTGIGYDLWHNGSGYLSFGQWATDHGVSVDSTIANRTMLYHGGSGVYDRIALHCYASTEAQFQDSTIANNPALQYVQWFQQVDSSEWVYVTEASGSQSYDDYNEGVALAWFEYNVSNLNAQSISSGGFGGQVQAVYGYILDITNPGASRNGIDRFSCHATDGYNAERQDLGF